MMTEKINGLGFVTYVWRQYLERPEVAGKPEEKDVAIMMYIAMQTIRATIRQAAEHAAEHDAETEQLEEALQSLSGVLLRAHHEKGGEKDNFMAWFAALGDEPSQDR